MMECFYYDNLSLKDSEVDLLGEEFRHLKARRVQKGDTICLVNGRGLAVFGYVFQISKTHCKVKILNFIENLGEIDSKIDLALGILENKERFEFAFEKAIEFRITEFYPLITKHTQKNAIEFERLQRKAIASIKQTFRSQIPIIHLPITLNECMKIFKNYDKVFVLDRSGNKFTLKEKVSSFLILVGPEGGFCDSELRTLSKRKKVEVVRICEFPLRSETAVAGFLALLSSQL